MKGGLSADKLQGFTQFQVATSNPLAAQNEGGAAALGATLGAGVAVGQAMAQGMTGAFAPASAPPTAQAAATAPAAGAPEERLAKLKGMLDKGLISQADYDGAKAEILKQLIG
jgi:membrane protease subunit (stomatin/prohibitin family)